MHKLLTFVCNAAVEVEVHGCSNVIVMYLSDCLDRQGDNGTFLPQIFV